MPLQTFALDGASSDSQSGSEELDEDMSLAEFHGLVNDIQADINAESATTPVSDKSAARAAYDELDESMSLAEFHSLVSDVERDKRQTQRTALSVTQQLVLKGIAKAEKEGDGDKAAFLRKLWRVDGSNAFQTSCPSAGETSIHVCVDLAFAASTASHREINSTRNLVCYVAAH